MKFAVAAVLAVVGFAAAAPLESATLAKAKAVYKRNSPLINALRKRDLDSRASAPSDADILNFALNLEYLEATYYNVAAYGKGLAYNLRTGTGTQGKVTGGRKVNFKSSAVRQYAEELAGDELNHVKVLRGALASGAVAQPALNIGTSFTAAATAAGIIKKGQTFDPYASDESFLLGSFLFEDVGVTAYNGAAPLISSKDYLAAAASILAVEAYHAGSIRAELLAAGAKMPSVITAANKAAAAEGALDDGKSEGITKNGKANVVAADGNSLAFARTPGEVADIVYLTGTAGATKGGFFPGGLNGAINTAAGAGN